MKMLCELDRGRFCWVFKEFGLCPEGSEEPRRDFQKGRGPICCQLGIDRREKD